MIEVSERSMESVIGEYVAMLEEVPDGATFHIVPSGVVVSWDGDVMSTIGWEYLITRTRQSPAFAGNEGARETAIQLYEEFHKVWLPQRPERRNDDR